MDSITIRRINAVKNFLYRTATGRVIDNRDYIAMLKEAEDVISKYRKVKAGEEKTLTIGLAFGVE
ncbi:MAG: hypothetical protein QXG05_07125 [Nitrososphaerota archaeon]